MKNVTRRHNTNVNALNKWLANRQGYRWLDKDESLTDTLALMDECRLSYEEIAHESGLCLQTLYSWKFGRTLKPLWESRRAVWKVLANHGMKQRVVEVVLKSLQ